MGWIGVGQGRRVWVGVGVELGARVGVVVGVGVGVWVGWGAVGWGGSGGVGYLWSNYECHTTSGCKDIDFQKTPTQKYCFFFKMF